MKKFSLVALGLLVLAVAAFAEEAAKPSPFTISGALYTGAALSAVNGQDAQVYLYSNTLENAGRFDLNLNFTEADFGAAVRLRSVFSALDSTVSASSLVSLPYAYGWFEALGDAVKVKAGIVSDAAWETVGYNEFGYIGNTGGVQVQVKPMEGLNVGFFLPVSVSETGALDALTSVQFGAAYSIKGLADLSAGYILAPTAAADSDVYFGLNLTAVENLTGILEANWTDIGENTAATFGSVALWEKVGYKAGIVDFGLEASQGFDTVEGTDLKLVFDPYASVTITEQVSAAADVSYDFYTSAADAGTLAAALSCSYSFNSDNVLELGATWSNENTSTFGVYVDYVLAF